MKNLKLVETASEAVTNDYVTIYGVKEDGCIVVKDKAYYLDVTYNITDISAPSPILIKMGSPIFETMKVDGVKQECASEFQFDSVGEHNIQFMLTNGELPNINDAPLFANDSKDLVTKVVIPDSVTKIYSHMFQYCPNMTSINIPDSVTSIGYNAFMGNTSLTSMTVPSSVTHVDGMTFMNSGVSNLVFYAPGELLGRTIDRANSITAITLGGKCTEITSSTFSSKTTLQSLTIEDTVVKINNYAFNNSKIAKINSNTYGECIIPNSVTSIGDGIFQRCPNIKRVIIPDSVTSIGSGVFSQCSGLTSVTLSNNITSITDYMFANCTSLTSVTYNGTIAQWNAISKGTYWKGGVPTTCQVHCTDGDIAI